MERLHLLILGMQERYRHELETVMFAVLHKLESVQAMQQLPLSELINELISELNRQSTTVYCQSGK
jgi:hypothetical protein